MNKEQIEKKIEEIESAMQSAEFWGDKEKSGNAVKELHKLKEELRGLDKYEKGSAIISILAGAGGTDAEDWVAMLFRMYSKYASKKGYEVYTLHANQNEHGGFRNVTFEIKGKSAYGLLKKESGVHRLVRISPFNANDQRHTSFALVEVIPRFEKLEEMPIREDEVRIEYSKSGGPGGQNVNKRETAVRVVHVPTNISASSDNERSQAQNKEKAMQILAGKIFAFREEEERKKEAGLFIKGTVEIEWGNQIRSYVLHPYKMVKDLRTGVETSNAEKVLEGDLDEFVGEI